MGNNLTAMIGVGTPPLQAAAVSGTVQSGLTATGSTQGTALPITSNFTGFSTVAASTGAILPAVNAIAGLGAQQGDEYEVYNYGANALSVYPSTGGSIGTGAANAAFSVGAGKSAKFVLLTTTLWGVILSA